MISKVNQGVKQLRIFALRTKISANSGYATTSDKTIRQQLIKVAALAKEMNTRLWVKLIIKSLL